MGNQNSANQVKGKFDKLIRRGDAGTSGPSGELSTSKVGDLSAEGRRLCRSSLQLNSPPDKDTEELPSGCSKATTVTRDSSQRDLDKLAIQRWQQETTLPQGLDPLLQHDPVWGDR
mmetsp:Transcript_111537/g.193547  ORF Transcript_111537/g.193547 Transcript_111537/m.193547 type:complete len:116 (+) Transcript_111537:60-407(+)